MIHLRSQARQIGEQVRPSAGELVRAARTLPRARRRSRHARAFTGRWRKWAVRPLPHERPLEFARPLLLLRPLRASPL
eukprot:4388749-Alexandrium_andersonii.AAC.1